MVETADGEKTSREVPRICHGDAAAGRVVPRMSVRVGIGWGPFGGSDLAPDRFFGLVEWIEELGYDSIWLSDSATLGGPAPLVALAAVAARTRRLKLGTNVLIAPARNPVLLAKELATVDALSEGRLLPAFGLGIGSDKPVSRVTGRSCSEPRTCTGR